MTLPDSEKLIILPASEVNRIDETFTESVCGLVTPYVRAAVSGEACLWYERMGKFAEMQGIVQIGKTTYCFNPETNDWFISHAGDKRVDYTKRLTTPELINEFLKIK